MPRFKLSTNMTKPEPSQQQQQQQPQPQHHQQLHQYQQLWLVLTHSKDTMSGGNSRTAQHWAQGAHPTVVLYCCQALHAWATMLLQHHNVLQQLSIDKLQAAVWDLISSM